MNFKIQINHSTLLKLLLISSFLLFSIVTLFLSKYCSVGYNLSIYNNLPFPSLLLISLLILIGIGITLEGYKNKDNIWKIGFLLIILCNFIVLLLPYLIGYTYSSNADHLTHIGFVKDILGTGNLNSYMDKNIYPFIHILAVELSLFTKLSIEKIAFFLGPLFYFLFLSYTYILSRKLTPNSKILTVVAGTVLFCYFFKEIFPMGFAFLTYPLIFYVYYNYRSKKNTSYAILTLLLLLIMPFFHPIAAILLSFVLVVLEIGNFSMDIFLKNNQRNLSFTLIIFSLIIIMLWMWQTSWLWKTSVLNVFNFLNFDLLNQPFVNKANESFNKLGLNLPQIFELFVRTYGPIVLFSILSIITALKTIINRDFSSIKNRFIYLLSVVLFFCSVLWISDYIHPLTQLSSGRLIWVVIPLFPIFVGISLHKFINSKFMKNEKSKFILVFLIMGLSSLIALFSIYPSPQIYQFNTAVSTSEIDGAKWIISNSNSTDSVISIGYVPIFRYENALNGTLMTNQNRADVNGISDHFNYTKFNEIGEEYDKNKYIVLRQNFILSVYTGIYKSINRFNKEDFSKLEKDPTVSEIYEDGNMNILFIHQPNSTQ